MKKLIYLIAISLCITLISCEQEINKGVDFISPKAFIESDSLEVFRGDSVNIKILLTDESGISHVSLSYPEWNINDDVLIGEENITNQYHYSYTIKVPMNAVLEWEENYQKHDGTNYLITQHYHKFLLTSYDGVKNKNSIYIYIKAK